MAIINTPSGIQHETSIRNAAIGFTAESIVITGRDVTQMRNLFLRDPDQFATFLAQLEARFPENRLTLDDEQLKMLTMGVKGGGAT